MINSSLYSTYVPPRGDEPQVGRSPQARLWDLAPHARLWDLAPQARYLEPQARYLVAA